MIYLIELEDIDTHETRLLEAASDSPLEELSARIKVAFNYSYDDLDDHEFCFFGHKYVPADMVGRVSEFRFETWDPEDPREEPDWWEMYRSSDDITLEEAFTVLGSGITYHQGLRNARLTLVERVEDSLADDRFEQYDYLQDKFYK